VDFTKDEVLLNVVLDACVRLKDMRRLLLVVEKVKGTKMNPSVATISTLMKAFSSLRRIDDVKELWREMTVVREMEPNEISIGCVVDALVSNDRLDEAVDLVKEWKDRVPVNCVIGSTLIKGFAIARDADRAQEVFEMMSDEGITPNLVTLNTLLDAFARAGRMEKAAEIMGKIQTHSNMQPDRITYSTMIKGFCLQGQVDKAIKVMDSMHKHRLHPDPIIYNTILDGCVAADQFALCDQLFERMQSEGVKPSNFTLTVMIKRFGREGNLNKACECANTFPEKFGFKINVHALTCLISACLANRQLGRALKVFERMRTEGPAPDAMAYDKLINGCLRTGDADTACDLVEHAYGLRGPIGHMSSMPGTKCPSGVVTPGGTVTRVSSLSPHILENMVEHLCKKGLAESKAVPLVEKLRAAQVPIPQKIFSSTLRGAVQESFKGQTKSYNGRAPWRAETIPEEQPHQGRDAPRRRRKQGNF
jgi:pentatricopeptide repeat protein